VLEAARSREGGAERRRLSHSSHPVASNDTLGASHGTAEPAHGRPDVFVSYAREDKEFVEGLLTRALVAHGKNVWIDVEDIRGGASDWRASVWAGIESAKVVVFVLTPDSLASEVCGEELRRADELNKRIIPVLRRSVDDLPIPPPLARPNWILARAEDDFDSSMGSLVDALELDEAWVEQHARLTQRTGEWVRHQRDGSYLLRGSDLRAAERWLDDQGAHREAPTADQITYITASRRAAARRQRALLAGVGLALAITAVLAVVALVQWRSAVDREKTTRAQARAAQSIAALSRDPEESLQDALAAVRIRPDLPEANYALRRAVSLAGWTRLLRLPEGRDVPLLDVEFSDDGSRVATAGSDRRVVVWDTRTGRRITARRSGGAVHTVQFSPDGKYLLTASDGGVAQIWDSSTGRLMHEFDTKSDVVWSATWGAGGRRILTATAEGGELWNAAGGSPLWELPNVGGLRGTIRMSLDGRRALTAGGNGAAQLWNLVTGERTMLPGPNKSYPLAFALLSADGRRFATFYADGAFCVWDDGRPNPRICVPRGDATDEDLSRDGRRVLRVGSNGVVEVWDAGSRDRTPIARLHNGGPVSSAQFDRTGEYVVTGSDDGFARVWRVKPTRRVALLRGHTRGVRRARFSPDGTQVATVSDDGSARLWPSRPRTPDDADWQSADSTSFGPNSRDVLLVHDHRRAIWNTDTGKVVELRGGAGRDVVDPTSWPCGHVAGCSPWSPNGRLVAGANADGRAVIWSAHTGDVVRPVGSARGPVIEAAFSPDGRRLVVVDGSQSWAQIWDVSPLEPKEQVPSRGSGRHVASAQFVANPLRILTVDSDGNVQLSNAATGQTVALLGATFPAAVSATSDGRRIAVGTKHGWLRVFSRGGGAAPPKRATDGAVTSLEFSSHGAVIATGGQRGTVTMWEGGELRRTPLRAFGGRISGATFSPDGGLLLVTSEDKARLWDRTLRRVVVDLPSTRDVRAEFSPDGSEIVIAGRTRLEVLRCVACLPFRELKQRARSLLPAP
jgi:WD40 repeat protein